MDMLARWQPQLLSVLRIMTALVYLQHGTQKLLHFPVNPGREGPAFLSLIWFAGVIELVGGTLLTFGLFTRIAAFVVSGEAACAYFIGHAPDNFFPALNGGNEAVLLCFVFLYIAAAGPGPWSVDAAMARPAA